MRTKESVYIRKARVELLPQNLFGTPIWPIWPDDHTRYNELTLQQLLVTTFIENV